MNIRSMIDVLLAFELVQHVSIVFIDIIVLGKSEYESQSSYKSNGKEKQLTDGSTCRPLRPVGVGGSSRTGYHPELTVHAERR
jgi:hypothetical protein